MNMFPTEEDENGNPCPFRSGRTLCDKHMKILVEVYQMGGSAVIRHGATPDMMPLTKAQTPLRGGYPHHPMTKWIGDSRANYLWAMYYGATIAIEYEKRYGKEHFCAEKIEELFELAHLIPEGEMTPMPRCFNQSKGENLDLLDESVWPNTTKAYREFYRRDKKNIAKWERGRSAPFWWTNDFMYGVQYHVS
jgi:hypothetical protein